MAKRKGGDDAAVADFVEAEGWLFGVPLKEFVATRTRLSRELKSSGDAAGARALAFLRKPTVDVWA